MIIKRREFIKGCATIPLLTLPAITCLTSVAKAESGSNALAPGADFHIEKSIKAGFGGGFSVLSHSQSEGLIYADIAHCGNRYVVASTDCRDWEIVRSSLHNPGFVSG
jgi:hypothetical protein